MRLRVKVERIIKLHFEMENGKNHKKNQGSIVDIGAKEGA